jgi:drug/metabolite transporter (DMT)-like permease
MLAGMLFGLAASASWALANVAVARASRTLGPYRALLWAQLAGMAMIAALAPLERRPEALTPEIVGWLAIAGVASLLAYVCLFYALAHGRLTLAVPIMSSWAVLSTALSIVWLGERLTPGQIAGAAAIITGAVVVSRHAHGTAAAAGGAPAATPRWLLASIGAAIGFGLLMPAVGRMAPVFGSIGVVAVVYAADLVLGVPLALGFRIGMTPPRGRVWVPVLLAGLFETAGFVFIALGARFAPMALVSPLASLASAITVAYAWVVLRERPARGVLVGAALVSAGVVVLAL